MNTLGGHSAVVQCRELRFQQRENERGPDSVEGVAGRLEIRLQAEGATVVADLVAGRPGGVEGWQTRASGGGKINSDVGGARDAKVSRKAPTAPP